MRTLLRTTRSRSYRRRLSVCVTDCWVKCSTNFGDITLINVIVLLASLRSCLVGSSSWKEKREFLVFLPFLFYFSSDKFICKEWGQVHNYTYDTPFSRLTFFLKNIKACTRSNLVRNKNFQYKGVFYQVVISRRKNMLVRSPKSNIFSSTSLKLGRGSVLLLTALVFYWHCGSCGKKCQGVQTLAVVTLISSLLTDPTISSIPEGYQLRFSSGKTAFILPCFPLFSTESWIPIIDWMVFWQGYTESS